MPYIIIHDLNPPKTTYIVQRWEDAYDTTDRSAAKEAFDAHQTVTMGKVIAEYHP